MNLEGRKKILFVLLIVLLFVIRYWYETGQMTGDIASDSLVGNQSNFSAKIVSEPDEREANTHYVLMPDNFDGYKVLITTLRFPKYAYGDIVEFSGALEFPENFTSDLGREFDYKNYLAKDGIRYVSFRPEIIVVESGQGNLFLTFLYKLKNKFIANVQDALPEPASSLV